jgi:hypothetical protein
VIFRGRDFAAVLRGLAAFAAPSLAALFASFIGFLADCVHSKPVCRLLYQFGGIDFSNSTEKR